jgi:hypothetical protein
MCKMNNGYMILYIFVNDTENKLRAPSNRTWCTYWLLHK